MALVASRPGPLTFRSLKTGSAIGMMTCDLSIRSTSDPASKLHETITRERSSGLLELLWSLVLELSENLRSLR